MAVNEHAVLEVQAPEVVFTWMTALASFQVQSVPVVINWQIGTPLVERVPI